MTSQDFDVATIGLKIGLEFHQQLYSPYIVDGSPESSSTLIQKHGSKLFCRCPAMIRNKEPDFIVKRRLRAIPGETGYVDLAAKFEEQKDLDILYGGFSDSNCLIELDEQPIQHINPIAVKQALSVAHHIFNMNIVDEIHPCRKIVVDGSNVSGFQRTCLIATGTDESHIEVEGKKISIQAVCLEEESAKNRGYYKNKRFFSLDRQGIPLIEIATGPDMKKPQEVLAVARAIGERLRMTSFVKRGLGTIRQDINVSIKGSSRVEIKGVQNLDLIPRYVYNEAFRQYQMIQVIERLKKHFLNIEDIERINLVKLTHFCQKINISSEKNTSIYGAKIHDFNDFLSLELQQNYTLGDELITIARVNSGMNKIYHAAELPNQHIPADEVIKIKNKLDCEENDAYLVLIGNYSIVSIALNAIKNTLYNWVSVGLSAEVRGTKKDGTTTYLRPLPSEARMYPETDIAPFTVDKTILNEIVSNPIERPATRIERLRSKYHLSDTLINGLYKHPRYSLFEHIVKNMDIDPTLVATTIVEKLKRLNRKGIPIENISDVILENIFHKISSNSILRDAIDIILEEYGNNTTLTIEQIIENRNLNSLSYEELEDIIDAIVDKKKEFIKERGKKAIGALISQVMNKYRGRVEGSVVAEMVNNAVQKIIDDN